VGLLKPSPHQTAHAVSLCVCVCVCVRACVCVMGASQLIVLQPSVSLRKYSYSLHCSPNAVGDVFNLPSPNAHHQVTLHHIRTRSQFNFPSTQGWSNSAWNLTLLVGISCYPLIGYVCICEYYWQCVCVRSFLLLLPTLSRWSSRKDCQAGSPAGPCVVEWALSSIALKRLSVVPLPYGSGGVERLVIQPRINRTCRGTCSLSCNADIHF